VTSDAGARRSRTASAEPTAGENHTAGEESDVSTEPQELRKEIDDLKSAQAAQAATQLGQMATFTAMNAGTLGMIVAGGAGLIAGLVIGLLIRGFAGHDHRR
jgi:hypothetical protein